MPLAPQVAPLSAASPATAARVAGAAQNNDNYNAFLQLLVTQLKNQDPLKPLDPTQTVTQLATFANVEQATRANALLLALADNSALSQASALVGRTVASPDGSITGVVKSIMVDNGALIANLENGARLQLGSGVTIS
jgi:flagellar basal-body rod modification protein FlgD